MSAPSITRREALGAAAGAGALALGAPVIAAEQAQAQASLSLRAVPLAVPPLYRTAMRVPLAETGEAVHLVEGAHPNGGRALSVVSKRGERMGYIPLDHQSSLRDAMAQGSLRAVTVARVDPALRDGKEVPGWGAYHLDIELAA